MSSSPAAVVEVAGIVAASPDEVWPLLVEIRRAEAGEAVTVDDDARRIRVDGQWWYSGRDVVEEHPRGTRVEHRVVNQATGPGRLVAQFVQARSHRRHAREEFVFLLGTIGQRLGCRTWVPEPGDE